MTHNSETTQKPQICHYLLGAYELVHFVVGKENRANMLKILGTATKILPPDTPVLMNDEARLTCSETPAAGL
jgi:hypothetical protein